jgi:hypothetical protein
MPLACPVIYYVPDDRIDIINIFSKALLVRPVFPTDHAREGTGTGYRPALKSEDTAVFSQQRALIGRFYRMPYLFNQHLSFSCRKVKCGNEKIHRGEGFGKMPDTALTPADLNRLLTPCGITQRPGPALDLLLYGLQAGNQFCGFQDDCRAHLFIGPQGCLQIRGHGLPDLFNGMVPVLGCVDIWQFSSSCCSIHYRSGCIPERSAYYAQYSAVKQTLSKKEVW